MKENMNSNVVTCIETSIKTEELKQLPEYLYEVFNKCIDSQIYIENELVEYMQKTDIIRYVNFMKGFHYGGSDDMFGVERTYEFPNQKAKIFLAHNCKGYQQVTAFGNQNIGYCHYTQGIKQIVFIKEEK